MSPIKKPPRKFRYALVYPDGKRDFTGNMQEASRLGAAAPVGTLCKVMLLGDRESQIGQSEFVTGPVRAYNIEQLNYNRWLLKDRDKHG